jgi:ribose/xylose/arabinose/galactoside ABC-type transport system permease subunit
LSGGRGSVSGSLAGAAIMAVIRSGCDQLEIPTPYQEILIGAIIIGAVALDRLRQRT